MRKLSEVHEGFHRLLTPLEKGISVVGIGKKKSQCLSVELLSEIKAYLEEYYLIGEDCQGHQGGLESREVVRVGASIGAFLAALLFKAGCPEKVIGGDIRPFQLTESLAKQGNVNKEEIDFLNEFFHSNQNPSWLIKYLGGGHVDKKIGELGVRLLFGETLTSKEAYKLGLFLNTPTPIEAECAVAVRQAIEVMKGFFASFLRVRYETEEEMNGLYDALASSVHLVDSEVGEGGRVEGDKTKGFKVLLVEPFNGNKHNPLITPLIGQALEKEQRAKAIKLTPYYLVGKNPGPKFVCNSFDVLKGSNGGGLSGLFEKQVVDLYASCPPLADWIDRRWRIMKRPFFSTVEKFLNPINADYLISSAFHPPYLEKMLALGEYAGYRGMIICKLGVEGGLCPSLSRDFKLVASRRIGEMTTKKYERKEFVFSVEDLKSVEDVKGLGSLEKRMDKKIDLAKWGVEANQLLLNYLLSHNINDLCIDNLLEKPSDFLASLPASLSLECTTFLKEQLQFQIRLATYAYQAAMSWLLEMEH